MLSMKIWRAFHIRPLTSPSAIRASSRALRQSYRNGYFPFPSILNIVHIIFFPTRTRIGRPLHSSHFPPSMASPSSLSCTLLLIATLLTLAQARDYLVGGKANAWKVPSSEADSLNKWAESNRFLIGDHLVWEFDGKKDSVVEVTREAYLSCNSSHPIAVHGGGEAKVKLARSGPFYFISGVKESCEKGEKLIVVVLSSSGQRAFFNASPAPAPVAFEGPGVAPTSGTALGKRGTFGSLLVLVGLLLLW